MADNPNDRQVGGGHYKTGGGAEHWDWVETNGIGYLEGCATKYVARSRRKHASPCEDLNKALHYTDKAIQLVRIGAKRPQLSKYPGPFAVPTKVIVDQYELNEMEAHVIELLGFWSRIDQLVSARKIIEHLIAEAEKEA